ncbi:MAG: hypothetical protein LBV00_07710 [Propionibacteriaceae bacterium]|jgi:uncharacterized membrane protein YesL|nr:hypothetical protein [Propionibacteriaceae bacterium]
MRGFSGAFLNISGLLYIMLATNVMVAVTCLPVWMLALLVDLRYSWLWVVVTAILLAPALAGAFGVFKRYSVEGSTDAIRTYFRVWASSWKRVWPVGLAFVGFATILGLDLYAVTLWGFGTLALPITVVLATLALITVLVSWVALFDRPDLTRRAVVKASLYFAVRHPGWSLLSLGVLATVGSIIWVKPAIGLGLLIGPALYIIWGNSRRTLRSILPTDEQVVDEDSPRIRRQVEKAA